MELSSTKPTLAWRRVLSPLPSESPPFLDQLPDRDIIPKLASLAEFTDLSDDGADVRGLLLR